MENNENNVQNQVKENENNPQKSGKKLTIVLSIIVLILVLALCVFAGLLISGNGNKIINQVEEKIVQNDNNKTSKKIDESKDWVYDADYLKENKKIYQDSAKTEEYAVNSNKDLIVPYININSEYAKTVNENIKALYDDYYSKYGTEYKNPYNKESKEYNHYVLEYDKYVNDNILSIVITLSEVPVIVDGGAGGGTFTKYTYNFNLDTLNEATLNDMAIKCGFESEYDVTSKIKEWEEKQRNILIKADQLYIFKGVQNGKYFIDENGKLNFLYRFSTSSTGDSPEIIEPDKEIEFFYTEEQANEQIKINNEENQNNNKIINKQSITEDYSVFTSYKNRTYKNEDFNTTPDMQKEYCELKFDANGKPTVKVGYKSDNNTECYFQTKDISNLKSDIAAGTTYVTFDFTAWTPGGDTTGNATISFSNVSEDYTMTVSAKANFDIGTREYNNIKVKAVGQTAVENFVLPEFKNRIYENQDNLTGLWYKLEFDENGKPTITITSSEGENKQIVDKYTRFTDVYSDGAAGTTYINFSYRLMNETGNKVEGHLGYSNNTDNNELRLKLNNLKSEIMVKRVK